MPILLFGLDALMDSSRLRCLRGIVHRPAESATSHAKEEKAFDCGVQQQVCWLSRLWWGQLRGWPDEISG